MQKIYLDESIFHYFIVKIVSVNHCTGGGSSAITLQAADVKAISVADCKGYWSNTGEGHICVWVEGSKGACNVSLLVLELDMQYFPV